MVGILPESFDELGKNAKDNVIDLYYEKTVDLRADASVQVIHHYTTKTWVVENGQSVLKESTNTVDGVRGIQKQRRMLDSAALLNVFAQNER